MMMMTMRSVAADAKSLSQTMSYHQPPSYINDIDRADTSLARSHASLHVEVTEPLQKHGIGYGNLGSCITFACLSWVHEA